MSESGKTVWCFNESNAIAGTFNILKGLSGLYNVFQRSPLLYPVVLNTTLVVKQHNFTGSGNCINPSVQTEQQKEMLPGGHRVFPVL